MNSHKRVVCSFASVVLVVVALAQCVYAGDLNYERGRAKEILSAVSSQIAKTFYDKDLKGLDWKGLTDEARTRIDNAKSAGEMYTAIFALVHTLDDSHTVFLPPGRVEKIRFGFSAKAFGDDIRIYSITKNGAAAEGGLQVGDHIVSIGALHPNRSNFDLMMMYCKVLRPARQLQIEVARANEPTKTVLLTAKVKTGKQILDLSDPSTSNDIWDLIREEEDAEPVYYAVHFQDGIGYLHLPVFGTNNFRELVSKISDAKAVVIDLRGNGGGLLDGLRDLSGHFESDETVMANVVERQKTREEKVKPLKPTLSQKMVILIDSRSASASEIFARHFQQAGKAIVVGDKSSGRVNVARVFDKQIGTDTVAFYATEIAIGKVVLPGGEELEKNGVKPDVPCLPGEQDLRSSHDNCLVRALEVARKQLGLAPELADLDRAQIDKTTEKIRQDRERSHKE